MKPSLRAGKVIRKMMEQYISEGMAAILVGVHEDDIDKAAKSDTLLLQWLELKSSSGFLHLKKWQCLTHPRLRFGGKTVNRAEEDIAWCH
jgi:hypothetical protein